MQLEERKKIVATFDLKELKLIMTCLDYCSHRIREHNKAISIPKNVDSLRKEIRDYLEYSK